MINQKNKAVYSGKHRHLLYGTSWTLAMSRSPAEIAEARMILSDADVNTQLGGEWTLLGYAVDHGNLKMVELLLELGADPNQPYDDAHGLLVLNTACCRGYADIINALLAAGANLEGKDSEGITALISAAQGLKHDVVTLLLQKGANVHCATKTGETAIISASERGDPRIARILMQAGATISCNRLLHILETFVLLHDASEMTTTIMTIVMRSQLSILRYVNDASSSKASKESPFVLLRGFPEILRFILVRSMPDWFVRTIDSYQLP